MADILVTQAGAEILYTPDPEIAVSQAGVEVLHTIDVTNIAVSQVGVEIVFTTDVTNVEVHQIGVEICYCMAPAAVTSFAAAISGDDIELTWTENSYADIRIEHSTNGASYSLLVEMFAGTASYTHTAPDKNLPHYYRITAFDGACNSSVESALAVFGAIYTYCVRYT